MPKFIISLMFTLIGLSKYYIHNTLLLYVGIVWSQDSTLQPYIYIYYACLWLSTRGSYIGVWTIGSNKMEDYLKDGKSLAFMSAIVRGKDGQIGL